DRQQQPQQQPDPNEDEEEKEEEVDNLALSSSSDSDSDSDDSDYNGGATTNTEQEIPITYTRPGDEPPESENTPEINLKRFSNILNSRRLKRKQEEEDRKYKFYEDLFDFPEDPEKWREEDLRELWADAPLEMTKPGWDPYWADEDDWEVVREEIKAGRDPPIAPFYLPYRKPYPAIPDNHFDISTPKKVVEELDRIEEFLTWVSYVFADGSSYEGTVWDDLAHGKGVYIAEKGLVRYEGEWLQNNMEGHGVVEVDIPDIEPVPGSKLEAKMRAEGKIISRDFMSPEDRKWLEMDIEDHIQLADGDYEIPFYENDEWIKYFGSKPEKGRYRYAGQWKQGRMHGCGVYEVNERTIYGRFYFGELVDDDDDKHCNEDITAVHASIAEIAAAKARMFVNKPDGMVREERGPYNDPQHPYFYEEEDVWMAPGFINQFYEVPDYWKTYVHEVDQERQMWLNSFYKSPLRIPMPAELEYWWSKDHTPEFVILNKEPEPDPEDPSKLIYMEDPVILHTPSGLIINYIEDEKYGIRLFWQPPLKEGEDVDPEKAVFLPLGFDEFFGNEVVTKKENIFKRVFTAVENVCKPMINKIEKWSEEKKRASELKIELMEKELELKEAELCLEEAIEDMDEELKIREKEEEEKVELGLQEDEDSSSLSKQEKATTEEDEEEEEEEDDDVTPSSFGSVTADEDPTKKEYKGSKPRESPFSTLSLSFLSRSLILAVPSGLQQSFTLWKAGRQPSEPPPPSCADRSSPILETVSSVSFPLGFSRKARVRAMSQALPKFRAQNNSHRRSSQLHSISRILSSSASVDPQRCLKQPRAQGGFWLHAAPEGESDSILSLHSTVLYLDSCTIH
ncbi:MORN domain-containing protein, partial [Cephalotus follicularis]